MEKHINMEIRWGALTNQEKISRIAWFMNRFHGDSSRGKLKGRSVIAKKHKVPWMIIKAMTELDYIKVIDKNMYKCNYGPNDITVIKFAENVIIKMLELQNAYSARKYKKKLNILPEIKDNIPEIVNIQKENKISEIVERKLIKAIPDIIKKVKLEIEVELTIKFK